MLDALTSRWWLFLARGIVALAFGVAVFIWPGAGLLALTVLFGAYAFVDGILALSVAASGLAGNRWWAVLIEGLLGLVVAFYVFTQPVMSAAAFVYAIAFWAIFTGVMEIIAGIQLRDLVANEWMYILGGALSIAFGVLVLRYPAAGAVAEVWTIGLYAILFGITQIGVAVRLNQFRSVPHRAGAA